MVCSACGYENQVGHRFCGMCGMPLPHRPMTAPGANSTLNLTRIPVESGRGAQHSAAGRTSLLTEVPRESQVAGNADGKASAQATVDEPGTTEAPAVKPAGTSGDEPPLKELVPDLPLDEYVKSFHYEPPSDPTEITMRCDAPVETAEPPRKPETVTAPSIAPGDAATPSPNTADANPASTPASESKTIESKAINDTTSAAAADLDSRLGLEPEAPGEARIARPRFLDINEPQPSDTKPGASGTSTIVGPSFLGLSDAPEEAAEPSMIAADEAEPAHGRGRLWLAAAVVLIFAALGAMEWRAQRNQTGYGPVEIIKTKIRDFRHQNPPPTGSEATPGSSDSNAKPEIQVQDQSKPAGQDQATAGGPAASSANASSAGTASQNNPNTPPVTVGANTTAGSQVAPDQKAGNPAKQTPAPGKTQIASADNTTANQTPADASKPSASQKTPQAEKPTPNARSADDQEVVVKQIVPGADEMTRAKNASDAAATAAWLWKATAKGNPDAPVQLADMYTKGDGVPRSCEQAVVLLKTAAEKENARARNRLASMYATGDCVPRSRVEAYRWVSSALAANPDSQWAQQNRNLLWQQMTPDERAAAGKYR